MQKNNSLIYRDIRLYRLVMNTLYFGNYVQRFRDVLDLFPSRTERVVELCFGDTYIADHCKQKGIDWTGFDLSEHFVGLARKKGHHAICQDVFELKEIPEADACLMIGSLYHFNLDTERVLKQMLSIAPVVIISEPVKNLSSQKGLLGKIAHKWTNAGKGKEQFRYNEDSLKKTLKRHAKSLGYSFEVVSVGRDMLVHIRRSGGGF